MAASKPYAARTAPAVNLRLFVNGELIQIQGSINSIVHLLGAIDLPIVVGANDSAGAGFRTVKIPNA